MPRLADMLGKFAGAPVVDETRLTGKYDFHLKFVPNHLEFVPSVSDETGSADMSTSVSAIAPDSNSGLDLRDAVQAQPPAEPMRMGRLVVGKFPGVDLGDVAAREFHDRRGPLIGGIGANQDHNSRPFRLGQSTSKVCDLISGHLSAVGIR